MLIKRPLSILLESKISSALLIELFDEILDVQSATNQASGSRSLLLEAFKLYFILRKVSTYFVMH